MEKIKIEPIRMKAQKVIRDHGCFVEFCDNKIIQVLDFTCEHMIDIEDESLGWKEVCIKKHIIARKSGISSIELSLTTYDQWLVRLSVSGMSDDIDVYFRSKEENKAREYFDKINGWLFS